MSTQTEQGTVTMTQTPEGIRFEKAPAPAPTGQAYVETARAKTTRELELEAGRKRVADAAALAASRKPIVKSDAELRAEGYNVAVFRHNMLHADRVTGNNGSPVSQQLGALLRKVGTKVKAPETAPVG
jgi:hypothetical protein